MVTAVTGASGHVGANLVRALVNQGERVRVLIHKGDSALQGLDVERVQGDVRNPECLKAFAANAKTVYHLAVRISLTRQDEDEVMAVNVGGTANVLEACQRAKVERLVHFSSIHAFAAAPTRDVIDEDRALNNGVGVPVYDRSKAAAERQVRAAMEGGMDAVIVNPTAVLGPHDYEPSAMGKLLLNIYHQRLLATVRGGFNWVDVRDVVAGALCAARQGTSGARYLLAGDYLPLSDLAALVQTVTGKAKPRMVVPQWLAYTGVPFAHLHARIKRAPLLLTHASLTALRNHRYISHARATRDLGYTPRPLQTTLESAFAWYQEANLL